MAGTFLVLVTLPAVAFQQANPLLLTAVGEFVVKNVVLLSAGLVVASGVRPLRARRAEAWPGVPTRGHRQEEEGWPGDRPPAASWRRVPWRWSLRRALPARPGDRPHRSKRLRPANWIDGGGSDRRRWPGRVPPPGEQGSQSSRVFDPLSQIGFGWNRYGLWG
jgi:hypothetical protein